MFLVPTYAREHMNELQPGVRLDAYTPYYAGLSGLAACESGEEPECYAAANPCGAGYTWNPADSSCTPTKQQIDTSTATLNWLKALGVSTPAAPKGAVGTSPLGGIEKYLPYIAIGGAVILVIGMMSRR